MNNPGFPNWLWRCSRDCQCCMYWCIDKPSDYFKSTKHLIWNISEKCSHRSIYVDTGKEDDIIENIMHNSFFQKCFFKQKIRFFATIVTTINKVWHWDTENIACIAGVYRPACTIVMSFNKNIWQCENLETIVHCKMKMKWNYVKTIMMAYNHQKSDDLLFKSRANVIVFL